MAQQIVVTIAATGDRASGKSYVLMVAREALIKAGFLVSEVQTCGDEALKEYIEVTTANVVTRTEWLTQR
jgi:dephospho-CoA kinase